MVTHTLVLCGPLDVVTHPMPARLPPAGVVPVWHTVRVNRQQMVITDTLTATTGPHSFTISTTALGYSWPFMDIPVIVLATDGGREREQLFRGREKENKRKL